MVVTGHNNPPSQIEFAQETSAVLGEWLKTTPVVETEEQAREGKLLVDRARSCVADLESERYGKVRPLNTQVRAINDEYRAPREVLERVSQELLLRLDVYRKAEEERREQIAEEARRAAEEAEQRAREAEAREQDAKDDASYGVEADVASAVSDANQAFKDYKRAETAAARAERDTTVRIGGGFNRSLAARTREELSVTDPQAAITQIGWTERLLHAILMEAREYRRAHGKLPAGITSKKERKL